MQNLREAIKTLKNQEDAATDPDKKEFAHIRAVNYLKRYFHLILFASYVKEQASGFDMREQYPKRTDCNFRKFCLLKTLIRYRLVPGSLKDRNTKHYCIKTTFQKWIRIPLKVLQCNLFKPAVNRKILYQARILCIFM